MSKETVPTTSIGSEKGKRRTTVPDVLRHQKSFENRYSHIITKQILETSINREELQRQLHAYFPISRSSSLQTNTADERRKEFVRSEPFDVGEIPKERTASPQKKLFPLSEDYGKQQTQEAPKSNDQK